jgi:hypothetical protein
MRTFWRYAALFAVLAVVSGAVYWGRSDETDWWALVDDPERGPWPKFKFQWPEQLVVSGCVGGLFAAPVTAAVFLVRLARPRLMRAKAPGGGS